MTKQQQFWEGILEKYEKRAQTLLKVKHEMEARVELLQTQLRTRGLAPETISLGSVQSGYERIARTPVADVAQQAPGEPPKKPRGSNSTILTLSSKCSCMPGKCDCVVCPKPRESLLTVCDPCTCQPCDIQLDGERQEAIKTDRTGTVGDVPVDKCPCHRSGNVCTCDPCNFATKSDQEVCACTACSCETCKRRGGDTTATKAKGKVCNCGDMCDCTVCRQASATCNCNPCACTDCKLMGEKGTIEGPGLIVKPAPGVCDCSQPCPCNPCELQYIKGAGVSLAAKSAPGVCDCSQPCPCNPCELQYTKGTGLLLKVEALDKEEPKGCDCGSTCKCAPCSFKPTKIPVDKCTCATCKCDACKFAGAKSELDAGSICSCGSVCSCQECEKKRPADEAKAAEPAKVCKCDPCLYKETAKTIDASPTSPTVGGATCTCGDVCKCVSCTFKKTPTGGDSCRCGDVCNCASCNLTKKLTQEDTVKAAPPAVAETVCDCAKCTCEPCRYKMDASPTSPTVGDGGGATCTCGDVCKCVSCTFKKTPTGGDSCRCGDVCNCASCNLTKKLTQEDTVKAAPPAVAETVCDCAKCTCEPCRYKMDGATVVAGQSESKAPTENVCSCENVCTCRPCASKMPKRDFSTATCTCSGKCDCVACAFDGKGGDVAKDDVAKKPVSGTASTTQDACPCGNVCLCKPCGFYPDAPVERNACDCDGTCACPVCGYAGTTTPVTTQTPSGVVQGNKQPSEPVPSTSGEERCVCEKECVCDPCKFDVPLIEECNCEQPCKCELCPFKLLGVPVDGKLPSLELFDECDCDQK